jgi:hypothetical protein
VFHAVRGYRKGRAVFGKIFNIPNMAYNSAVQNPRFPAVFAFDWAWKVDGKNIKNETAISALPACFAYCLHGCSPACREHKTK